MNNDILNTTTDTKTEIPTPDTTDSVEKLAEETEAISTPDVSEPAFDYQPPAVETPEPPAVNDMPIAPVPENSVKAVEEPTASMPEKTVDSVEQPVATAEQQPVQQSVQQPFQQSVQQPFQQPVQQPVQQPFQQPVQQPVQQPFQQPVQQSVQQPFQQPVQQPSPPGVTQQYYQYTPVNPALLVQQNTTDGFAVASLICAIAGLFSCCTVFPSFLALIFGAISKAKNDGTRPTGMSTAGLILGIIGIIINLLILLAMFYAE